MSWRMRTGAAPAAPRCRPRSIRACSLETPATTTGAAPTPSRASRPPTGSARWWPAGPRGTETSSPRSPSPPSTSRPRADFSGSPAPRCAPPITEGCADSQPSSPTTRPAAARRRPPPSCVGPSPWPEWPRTAQSAVELRHQGMHERGDLPALSRRVGLACDVVSEPSQVAAQRLHILPVGSRGLLLVLQRVELRDQRVVRHLVLRVLQLMRDDSDLLAE